MHTYMYNINTRLRAGAMGHAEEEGSYCNSGNMWQSKLMVCRQRASGGNKFGDSYERALLVFDESHKYIWQVLFFAS